MSKTNRTQPNPQHRSALKSLKDRGVLSTELVGLRYIISAATGTIDLIGANVNEAINRATTPENFHPNAPQHEHAIKYGGHCARLTVTRGHHEWTGTRYDLSSLFPENVRATQMVHDATAVSGSLVSASGKVYGDAVLVADVRQHWYIQHKRCAEIEVDDVLLELTTPCDLLTNRWGHTRIFFHQEPNAQDIFTLNLHF